MSSSQIQDEDRLYLKKTILVFSNMRELIYNFQKSTKGKFYSNSVYFLRGVGGGVGAGKHH